MCETKFYNCDACGTVIGMIHDGGAPIMCCGDEMKQLHPCTAAECECPISVNRDEYRIHVTAEKTVPKIEWVYLESDRGGQRKCLCCQDGGCETTVSFALADEKPRAVFAYSSGKLFKKEL